MASAGSVDDVLTEASELAKLHLNACQAISATVNICRSIKQREKLLQLKVNG